MISKYFSLPTLSPEFFRHQVLWHTKLIAIKVKMTMTKIRYINEKEFHAFLNRSQQINWLYHVGNIIFTQTSSVNQ